MTENTDRRDRITNSYLAKTLLSVLITVFLAGATWWADDVRGQLKAINDTLVKQAERRGEVNGFIKMTRDRLRRLEGLHDRPYRYRKD